MYAEVARVHVTGKLPWRPFMQARYIAARIAEGRSFQEVADLIGITKTKLRIKTETRPLYCSEEGSQY